MQTSGSPLPSPAATAHAPKEAAPTAGAASGRRASEHKDDGGGDGTVFSDLVAQAGARLDSQSSGAADASDATDAADASQSNDEAARQPSAADLTGAVSAAAVPLPQSLLPAGPAGMTPGYAGGHRNGPRLATRQAGNDAPAANGVDGKAPLAGVPGGAEGLAGSAAPDAAGDAAATAATAATATTGAAAAAIEGVRHSADGGKSAAPRAPAAVATTAPAPTVGAAQAALQLALREAGSLSPEPRMAPGRPGAAAGGVEINGGERESRARRGGPDAAADARAAASAAGRDAVSMVDGMGAAGSLTTSASADVTSLAGANLQPGAAAATPSPGGGADPSVFALTMNQVSTSTLAATRAEMMAALTQATVDVPVDHGDFAEAFARQSVSLVVQGNHFAEIQLNPRDMGPIRIQIALDANAASLDIEARHADTRAAIEASMPALRQMLADQGVRLADWRVDGQATGDREQRATGDGARHESRHADAQPAGSRQAGGDGADGSTGNDAAQAGTGFADGRGGRPAGGQADGWRSSSAAQPAPGAPPAESRGGHGGGNNKRIDLYA